MFLDVLCSCSENVQYSIYKQNKNGTKNENKENKKTQRPNEKTFQKLNHTKGSLRLCVPVVTNMFCEMFFVLAFVCVYMAFFDCRCCYQFFSSFCTQQ